MSKQSNRVIIDSINLGNIPENYEKIMEFLGENIKTALNQKNINYYISFRDCENYIGQYGMHITIYYYND